MIDTPRIVTTSVQPTACIRMAVPRSEIRNVMGPGFRELLDALHNQGVTPTGPWVNYHLRNPSDVFDFELSMPVNQPITPTGRVVNSHLPAVTAARTIYHGSYEGLPDAWGQFESWIRSQGHTSAPFLWEQYLTDPSANPDPATWRTELTRPLIK